MCFKMLAHAGVRSCMAVQPHPEGSLQGCACDMKLAVAEGWPLSLHAGVDRGVRSIFGSHM